MKTYLEHRIEYYDKEYRAGFALISDKKFDQLEKNLLRIDPKCDYFSNKNKLIFSSKKNEKKLIDIYLDTNKSKEVKEKNSNNEITKYQISIASTVRVKEILSENEIYFNISCFPSGITKLYFAG